MADRSTIKGEKGTSFSGAKSALFDHLNKLKKWREEQFEQFRNMQLMQVQETQKNVDQLLQTHKGMLSPNKAKDHQETDDPTQTCNVPNKYDSVIAQEQDVSLTGHFERCFSDSSHDASSLFLPNKNVSSPSHGYSQDEGYRSLEQLLKANTQKSEIREQKENKTTEKLKRPFLKKGTGLQRYMPISGSREMSKSIKPVKRKCILPQSKLKLKPPLRNTSSPSKEKKHVQFDIPCFQASPIKDVGHNRNFLHELPIKEPTLIANEGQHPHDSDELASRHSVEVNAATETCDQNSPSDVDDKNLKDYLSGNISIDSSISQVDTQKETKELKEFELLEHYAQNNSFNSDSSIVQRILNGEVVKPVKSMVDITSKPLENVHIYPTRHRPVDPITANNTMKPIINKYLKDVQEKKKHLQRLIEEIEPAMASLQKEITASASPEVLSDDDISSLPLDSNAIKDQETVAELDACDNSSVGSSSNSIMNDVDTSVIAAVGPDPYYLTIDNSHPANSLGNYQDVNVNMPNDKDMPPEASHDSLLKKKLKQLETEIIFFKEQNVKLAGLQKERDQMILRMQKDQLEFEKWKEQEKKKLGKEIEDDRRQLKRQKQTFERYQKLRQDNPTKTERAELNALRQQVEKLQQELKAKNIKWNNDSRLMKSKLTCTENERDSLKRENNRLEEQCQDLLATLKVKLKKQKMEELRQQKAEAKQKQKVDEKEKNKVDEKDRKKVDEKEKNKVDEKEKNKVMSENDNGTSEDADTVTQRSSGDSLQNATNLEWPRIEETPRDRSSVTPQPQRKVRFNLNPEFQNYDGNLSNQLNESSGTIEPNEPQVIPGYDNDIYCEGNDEIDSDLRLLDSGFDFREIRHKECIERIYETGEKEFLFSSGTKQCISADGLVEKYFFFNGDIREHFPDKRTAYTYVDGTVETKYPDGLILIEFNNGQIERHYPNQSKEVQFPDGTIHIMYADGTEEMRLENGTVMIRAIDGTETLEFTNGQKEIRTKTFKRREYPDGAVKILYTSGRQETRYANGRIRIKDRDGKVIVDTKILGLFNGTESSNSN